MRRLDLIVFKMYSFDAAYFNERLAAEYERAVVIYYDFKKIWIQHAPDDLSLKTMRRINVLPMDGAETGLSYYLTPFVFLINLLATFKFLFSLCVRLRPRILFIEHTYVAIWTGILRRMKLCGKSIYAAGDWVANDKNKKRILGRLHCNVIFPRLDGLACRLNDEVLNYSPLIGEARDRFWGKKMPRKEKRYVYRPQIVVPLGVVEKKCNYICFLGNPREESGLDIAIRSLFALREHHDVHLKIIGPKENYYERLKQLSLDCGVEGYVHILGFLKTEQVTEQLADCFCGINLLVNSGGFSSYTVPGKFFHYMQHLLPIIATEGTGPFVATIRERQLGIIVQPNEEAFTEAVLRVHASQREYKQSLLDYIKSVPNLDIKQLLES